MHLYHLSILQIMTSVVIYWNCRSPGGQTPTDSSHSHLLQFVLVVIVTVSTRGLHLSLTTCGCIDKKMTLILIDLSAASVFPTTISRYQWFTHSHWSITRTSHWPIDLLEYASSGFPLHPHISIDFTYFLLVKSIYIYSIYTELRLVFYDFVSTMKEYL